MKKYLPILKNSPFFKGLTDNEILSILHCVKDTIDITLRKCNDNLQKTGFLYFQSWGLYRSYGTCGVGLRSCYAGRSVGTPEYSVKMPCR